ncbi:inactive dual specificity phosphatase 27 [Anabas testudineus]|uniref:Inactive dual specificity phosphatase 27 n=1 Tax=Anabas testudineus TaxID=64144 RepID=A0A3Q1JLK0_ANATE|nr:inactive dual specificity phosphatase 27 [Anabas testudineus]XP_026216951.1 inactive dual specificity phosphatase 27 [Anabas testudineus]XP_026216952.1 inactive dual specificity phosphatase 27 [Anabas testudineus]XP_026216953.1 inactive dual specificity phosphatase 27 [Anabas testudineus]XP_026216954.1 inactive dual specificity phosphatase 27 [Anabas testudineus]
MTSTGESEEHNDQMVPEGDAEERSVRGVQSQYLRCPSPSFSMLSESRFSMISGSDAASIFMEPIHLSSAVAAKKIINEELPPRGVRTESIPESMLESAEQLMVEDLYNRVRDMIDDRSPYNTPCVLDIQRALVLDRLEAPINPVDEVWPNIFIAEKSVAVNKARLKRMGITHILNTAHGTGVYTSESFYAGMNIQYLGIEVDDFPDADISVHFRPTAEFLDEALLTHKGKVLVVSMMGVSRSAVLVTSYLMIFQHMTIMEALTSMRKKRAINPNEGFLKQLREFNENLMEERDDDDETLSQCSVIDARARARIFGESGDNDDDEDTDEDEEQSMIEVRAHSIMMEEEEDGESVMSSVASSAAAAAMKSGLVQNCCLDTKGSAAVKEEVVLPEHRVGEDGDDEDGLDSMIHEWQRRNEKYQSDEWWEAQLNSDGEAGESLAGGQKIKEGADADVESVTSEDVRAMKERLKRRNRRPPSDAMSTSSCTSYSDLWKQRLKEIEEQAAARYRKKEDDETSESTTTEGGKGEKNNIDEEVESILSDTSSMYNFCQKNREKLTPLERWRIKRIQFGWNKKDQDDGGKSSVGDGEKGDREGEAKTPSSQDVNLTAYQAWKLRQQKRLGEENTEEILELSRGEDSATIKRRQRREEILERSKKTLEESQSMCGWETESSISGGTIPLSAFWAGAGVSGPQSVINDDNMSMVSGRSTVISSVSQARSTRSAQSAVPLTPVPPVPPILPVPTMQGPGGEPMVNLASIQNWIANVVSETIKQKQSEMSLPPPSRAGSELSFGGASSVISGRGVEDDKASMLSGASHNSALPQGCGRATSVLSGGGARSISGLSGRGSALGSNVESTLGSKKNKITTTSVPLFSLFQDQVNLSKLDAMDKEIKSEMRDKMATYEKKKILEENKRSTLFKKKKQVEDEDEEDERRRKEEEFLEETKKKEKPKRTYGLSGCLNLNPALEKDKNTSIDDWLKSVRPPPRKPASGADADSSEDPYDDLDASASEFDFSSRRASYGVGEEDEETYSSRYRSRLREDLSREDTEYSCNGFTESHSYSRAERSYGAYEESREGTESYADYCTKRNYGHNSRYEGSQTEERRGRREEASDEEEDDIAAFITQTRQRIRARAAAEAEDDEVLAAWRAQQEAKSQSRNES